MNTVTPASVDIIKRYYRSGEIQRIASSITLSDNFHINRELQKDLAHDIVEALMRMDGERIKKLNSSGQLMYYVTGIARRMVFASKSKYHKEIMRYEKSKIRINNRPEKNGFQ